MYALALEANPLYSDVLYGRNALVERIYTRSTSLRRCRVADYRQVLNVAAFDNLERRVIYVFGNRNGRLRRIRRRRTEYDFAYFRVQYEFYRCGRVQRRKIDFIDCSGDRNFSPPLRLRRLLLLPSKPVRRRQECFR